MRPREAVELLKNMKWSITTKFNAVNNSTKALDMAITALEKQEQDRWIPLTERLPQVHESGNSFSGIFMQSDPVLVYGVAEYEEETQFHVVTYCDDLDGHTYWSTELDALTVKGVKAWRPLPEPYMEEES